MRISIHTEITQRHTCSACIDDEEASAGLHCQCIDTDVQLEVVGEVVSDESKSDYPFGRLSVPACIDILSIRDAASTFAWSPMEIELIERNDREQILEALWAEFVRIASANVAPRQVAALS